MFAAIAQGDGQRNVLRQSELADNCGLWLTTE